MERVVPVEMLRAACFSAMAMVMYWKVTTRCKLLRLTYQVAGLGIVADSGYKILNIFIRYSVDGSEYLPT